MRRLLIVTCAGFSLFAALPVHAVTGLKLTCSAQGLTPGARVWVEVVPQYQGLRAGGAAQGGFKDSGPLQTAAVKHEWQLEVPKSGVTSPSTYNFAFPVSVGAASRNQFGSILLRTRFRIDDPTRGRQNGYGEVIEQSFAIPAPAGATELTRCLFLRQEGGRLSVGTAADCEEATVDKAERSGFRAPGKMVEQ